MTLYIYAFYIHYTLTCSMIEQFCRVDYIIILIFFFLFSCLDLDQCQDDTKKIYLWKIWQINILDIWMQNQTYDEIKVSKKRNSILVLKDYVRRITTSRHKPFFWWRKMILFYKRARIVLPRIMCQDIQLKEN